MSSSKPRIYQVLDYFGFDHMDLDYAHKIHCPCGEHMNGDMSSSAKVFPATDTLHCFVYNKTYYPESLYAKVKGVSWYVAKKDCERLFPHPLTYSLYADDDFDVDRFFTYATQPSTQNHQLEFSKLASTVQKRIVSLDDPRYEDVMVQILKLSKTDFPKAQKALTKLAERVK